MKELSKMQKDMMDCLNDRLADAIDLVYQAKQAHWNVKGFEFRSLHLLFDEVAEEAHRHVDPIAERLVQLGGTTRGTIQAAADYTSLDEYPLEPLSEREHLITLRDRLTTFAESIREAIQLAEKLEDPITADLLIRVGTGIEKLGWMLGSHLLEETHAAPRKQSA